MPEKSRCNFAPGARQRLHRVASRDARQFALPQENSLAPSGGARCPCSGFAPGAEGVHLPPPARPLWKPSSSFSPLACRLRNGLWPPSRLQPTRGNQRGLQNPVAPTAGTERMVVRQRIRCAPCFLRLDKKPIKLCTARLVGGKEFLML